MRLGLAGARAVIAAAEAKARRNEAQVNIAVVDDGGHLMAFERMDGARPASLYTAITKATSAATFRQATRPARRRRDAADPLLNVSLQNAAEASGGKITALHGGVPVVVDGQIDRRRRHRRRHGRARRPGRPGGRSGAHGSANGGGSRSQGGEARRKI